MNQSQLVLHIYMRINMCYINVIISAILLSVLLVALHIK